MVEQFSIIRLWVHSFIIPTNIQCIGVDLTTDKSIVLACVCMCFCVWVLYCGVTEDLI